MRMTERKTGVWVALATVIVLAATVLLCAPYDTVASAATPEKVNWSLVDDFSSYNEGNWSKRDPYDTLSFNGNILFTNDRATEEYEGARLVANTKFTGDGGNVFDLTFSPFVNNIYKGSSDPAQVQLGNEHIRLNREMSFGILFGLDAPNTPAKQANYLRLSPPEVKLYVAGEEIDPVSGSKDSVSYMDADDPNTVRLTAAADGTVTVYLQNRSHSIDDVLAVYSVPKTQGYMAFTTNSFNIDPVDLSLGFKNISLTGTVERDFDNFDVLSVSLDTSRLRNAVVSDKPIELTGSVVCRPNLADYQDAVFSVAGDSATVDGNMLTVKSQEPFTVRMTSKYNRRVYDEFTVTPKVLEIRDLSILTDAFKDMTIYSQPVLLSTVVSSNYDYIRELNEVVYTVVSGPAELFTYYSVTSDTYLTQLRVTGAGKVVLRATSAVLDDVYDEVSFTVSDPEKEKKGGCGGALAGKASACGALCVLAGVAGVVMIHRIKRISKE